MLFNPIAGQVLTQPHVYSTQSRQRALRVKTSASFSERLTHDTRAYGDADTIVQRAASPQRNLAECRSVDVQNDNRSQSTLRAYRGQARDTAAEQYTVALTRLQRANQAIEAAAKGTEPGSSCDITLGAKARAAAHYALLRSIVYAQRHWQYKASCTSSEAIAAILLHNAPTPREFENATMHYVTARANLRALQPRAIPSIE